MIGIYDRRCVTFSTLELRNRLHSTKFLGINVHNRSFSNDVNCIRSCHSAPGQDVSLT